VDPIVMLAMAALNERVFADAAPSRRDAPAALAAEASSSRPEEDPVARGIVESVTAATRRAPEVGRRP
jgi:hypothetical protein